MAFKAAVFDLDGTLLNTIVDLALGNKLRSEQSNMPTYTVDEGTSDGWKWRYS